MSAEDIIQKAKVQLMLHQPFFASIVCRRNIEIVGGDNYTASIDLVGNIKVGRKFVEKLNVQQVLFLLTHEAMHYAMLHGLRRGWRRKKPFNVAADKVINDILISSGVGQFIDSGVRQDGAREFSAEQLYNENNDDGDGDGEGEGNEGGGQGHNPGEGWDDLDDAGEPENLDEHIENVRRELAEAVQAAKATGKMPAGLERLVQDMITPITPWQQLLERWMTGYVRADITWARPRKTMMDIGYFPSAAKKPSLGTVVIIGDTSGSISEEIPHFIGHMNSILESCAPEKVYFLHVDATVNQVDEFTGDDLPVRISKLKGGGGTDMGAGLRWIKENGIEPDVCVVLTDGYTPWPATAPLYPLTVLCTTDQKTPYGELIRYEMEAT